VSDNDILRGVEKGWGNLGEGDSTHHVAKIDKTERTNQKQDRKDQPEKRQKVPIRNKTDVRRRSSHPYLKDPPKGNTKCRDSYQEQTPAGGAVPDRVLRGTLTFQR
jgi:hypothetical protein